jgi:hypothetical protein
VKEKIQRLLKSQLRHPGLTMGPEVRGEPGAGVPLDGLWEGVAAPGGAATATGLIDVSGHAQQTRLPSREATFWFPHRLGADAGWTAHPRVCDWPMRPRAAGETVTVPSPGIVGRDGPATGRPRRATEPWPFALTECTSRPTIARIRCG